MFFLGAILADTISMTSAPSVSMSSLQPQSQALQADPTLAAAVATHAHTKHKHEVQVGHTMLQTYTIIRETS